MARFVSTPVIFLLVTLLAVAQQARDPADEGRFLTERAEGSVRASRTNAVVDEETLMLRKKLVDTVRDSAASMTPNQLRVAIAEATAAQQLAKAQRELEGIKKSLRALIDEYPGTAVAIQAEQMLQRPTVAPPELQYGLQVAPVPYAPPQAVPVLPVEPPSVAPNR